MKRYQKKRIAQILSAYELSAQRYLRIQGMQLILTARIVNKMNYYRIMFPLTFKRNYPGINGNIDLLQFTQRKYPWINPMKDPAIIKNDMLSYISRPIFRLSHGETNINSGQCL
jgi:hypothetical protein